jgi:hypothetical protein
MGKFVNNIEEFFKFCSENEVKFVDFRFTDLKGMWHHVTYNIKAVNKDLLANGMPFDSSPIADAQRRLIKEGKVDEVISGMKRQLAREDWTGSENTASKEDIEEYTKINNRAKILNSIAADYKNNRGGIIDGNLAIMKLQKDGNMTRQEAEKEYKKLKQELDSSTVKSKVTGTDLDY